MTHIKCMNNNIQEIWDEHRKQFWKPIFDQIEFQDQSFQNSILFWGVIKLSTFQDSIFFSNCKLTCNNENVHVFFISRLLSSQKIRHYFFLNTIANKNRILYSNPINQEESFLKLLYKHSLSFSSIFAHKFSWNCWLSILEMERNH